MALHSPQQREGKEGDKGKQEILRLEGSCPWAMFLLWAGLKIAPFHSAHWPRPKCWAAGPEGI